VKQYQRSVKRHMIHKRHYGMTKAFEIAVDEQVRETWDTVIAGFYDASIYQSWAYGAVRWGERNLSHLVLYQGQDICAAAQLRIARIPFMRAGIAYLTWGPMCQKDEGTLDPSVVRQMVERLKHEYCQRRKLCLQIIPNMFPGNERTKILEDTFSITGFIEDGSNLPYRTVLVNLSPAPDILRKRLKQKWRNQLNRSEKNGLELEISDSRAAYEAFLLLYKEMFARKQFETSIDVKEFEKIQDHLSSRHKMLVFLARKEGETVAALVESHIGETAIYLLGATSPRGRELKAAYYLQWQAMLFHKLHGALYYDLGGIDPHSNPGGYHFKSGFGGEELTQMSGRVCPGGLLSNGLVALLSAWRRR